MKKLLLVPLFVCSLLAVPEISFAGCNSPVVLGFDLTQEPDDDEFLYETEDQFLLTKQGFINTGEQTSGSGRGYECDDINSPSCIKGDVIDMRAGHVFEGVVIPYARRYQCQTVGEDKWVVVDDNTCSTKGFGDILVGKCVPDPDGNSCRSLTAIDCSGYELTDVNGTVFNGICRDGPKFVCKAIECREGMHADNGICVFDVVQDKQEEEQETTATTSASVTKVSCTQRYGCYNLPADKQKACVACCSVSTSIANWNQKTQICECVNKSQTFDPDTKVCSGGDTVSAAVVIASTSTEPEKYDCDINKLLELRAKHSTNSEIVSLIDELIEKCEEGIKENEYSSLYAEITVSITNIQNAGLSSSRANILNAISKLDKLSSGFKPSVWKDEEGKFNTSRLLSDSVAGVVLGTAGGLITSSVVKKNQVENGFEDIQCTVGGQVVAGWGDQFQVGIQ